MVSGVRTLTFAAVCLIVSGMGVAVTEGPVWAHAELMKSSPINGAALTSSPSVIRAWFSEELAASGSYLRLYDAHNKILATGGLDAKVSNHEALRLTPPHLSSGSYLVRWHVVAADDNAVTQGSFRFSIGGQAMAPSGMTASSPPPLQLVAPADHASVKNPVALIIETSGDMKKLTMGTGQMNGMSSMAGMDAAVHLHIVVDGTTAMPSSDQLTALGNHRYRYTLAPLKSGSHTVKVFWADDKTHEPVGAVHTATYTVTQ